MTSCRWIPWVFAAGLGVVVAVNGALAYFAVSSSTGLVTDHPFEEGSKYNRVLATAAAQDALGWQGTLHFTATGPERGEIAAEIRDKAGRVLHGLSVTARLERPIEPLPSVVLPLAEDGAGRYVGAVALSRAGQWELSVDARADGERLYLTQRIVAK